VLTNNSEFNAVLEDVLVLQRTFTFKYVKLDLRELFLHGGYDRGGKVRRQRIGKTDRYITGGIAGSLANTLRDLVDPAHDGLRFAVEQRSRFGRMNAARAADEQLTA
jgi:hypothetical protein